MRVTLRTSATFTTTAKTLRCRSFSNSGYLVPTDHWWQRARPLLVPVAHAEYEWIVTGPKINADVTFYFGIDGRAEFRTNDQLNQPWVMGRHAHEYRGADAAGSDAANRANAACICLPARSAS